MVHVLLTLNELLLQRSRPRGPLGLSLTTIYSQYGLPTILVKLELWESVMVIISFGLPLTYAYATLRQSVAGNRHFGVLFFAI
jgi:hypothetical protein